MPLPSILGEEAGPLVAASARKRGGLSASSAWAVVPPGTSFGAIVNAGGRVAGGEYQSSASSQYANTNAKALASGSSDSFSLHATAWTSEDPKLPSCCTVYTCSWQTHANVSVWDTITVTAKADGSEGPQTLKYAFVSDGSKHRGKWAYGAGAFAYGSYYFGTQPRGWFDTTTIALSKFAPAGPLTPVPEPGSLPLVLAALGVIGFGRQWRALWSQRLSLRASS